ncbi:MAG TPA: Na+/H+ antiporter NhaA [Solirubrobacteraceae bacterium]|nr:Na+/H+ antiporter NhaA [Solirubrobacteraceae bacterium]
MPLHRRTADAFSDFIGEEINGGKLLIAATAVALLWANLAGGSYEDVRDAPLHLGPDALRLQLTLGHWVSDGLLALFFFVAGLEIKRELTVGQLADRRAAMLPFFAAGGGMLVPALVAIAFSGGAALDGGAWAIPVATDIAFALGVLALVGSSLPPGVRVLLLSMAVIDDLAAIALIAVLFTGGLSLAWLAGGLLAGGAYWLAHRARIDPAPLLWAIAIIAWVCIHASGVHATVTGIMLGLLTPVRPRDGETKTPGERYEHRLHPISAGIAVPLFALVAAGIPLATAGDAVTDAIAVGVFAGLLLGKFAGVLGGTWLAVRLKLGSLPAGVGWGDVVPVAVLAGIGYTVSLLIVQLAVPGEQAQQHAATAVLAASVLASLAALVLLRVRTRAHGTPGGKSGSAV